MGEREMVEFVGGVISTLLDIRFWAVAWIILVVSRWRPRMIAVAAVTFGFGAYVHFVHLDMAERIGFEPRPSWETILRVGVAALTLAGIRGFFTLATSPTAKERNESRD